ncbi:MAG: 3'-5' exonuclease [Betaproteobacteria bacterium]|nr:3'-5' exonuclease [Betaproteobacteria bacterium]
MTIDHERHRPKALEQQRRHPGVRPSERRPLQSPTPLTLRPAWLSRAPKNVQFVFFDLETTGGNPSNSEVIEIAAIKERDGQEIGRFQTLVNPRRHIPRPVREITGIDQSMVKDAPVIEDVIDDLLNFIGDSVLVSHGVLNDFSFVAHYARKLRAKELPNFYVCTHLLVSNYLPNVPVKSLSGVANYFGLPVGNAHRAMADAEMTRDVFWEINNVCEKNGFKSVEDLLKIQADNQTLNRLGPGLLSHHVDKAPSTPGLLYLFNSSREVTYMSATPNMRKSLMNVTELSDERDFNRLLVDVTDYKFERTAHFLGALLQEKKELKKLELAVDPRKFEGRADNTIQILIPDDLLEYWENNPSALPFALPHHSQRVMDQGFLLPAAEDAEENSSADKNRLPEHERNQYVYAHLHSQPSENLKVPIRKTKRLVNAVKNPKYKLNRFAEAKKSCVHMGHLIAGTGWFLGPVEQPKLTKRRLDDLITLWPFHDQSLALDQRAELLSHFMCALLGKYDEEIERLVKQKNAVKNIFNPLVRHRLNQKIDLMKALRAEQYALPQQNLPKTGLAVVTNTDTKELDVAVVVHGRIRLQLKLPVEDGDKLRSSRFFTRLMAPYHTELKRDDQCIEFTEDVCNDLELFSHWFSRRRGEGDWVDFALLEPLYNPQVSE